MKAEMISTPGAAPGPAGRENPETGAAVVVRSGTLATLWSDYLVDAVQRNVLFLDVLRRRGNAEIEITARPTATVLHFDHEIVMSGRSLPRPIDYDLLHILPPAGTVVDPRKRPVVVVDPRAGQGPGIGGFKAQSEIGDALAAGHPVYFIAFGAIPEPGQQFLDVVEGQVPFFERVIERHPEAPRPFAIGNCQAGYQTLMVAMLRPDLFGPCLVAGSPMSYWQGEHGRNPMRYSGGLSGGSWLTALTSDLGKGKFDGTWLVLNFDGLNPANSLWGKQYAVYADVDTASDRYLDFERWWGDFIELNGDELQFLVDNLFIGDKLARRQLHATDGTVFDARNITSPIIVFTSTEDNISPPPQALGWVLDLYRDVDDLRASGRTIVYSLNHHTGHLGLFVSTKVAAKEDEEFVQMMDVIDTLPPGLHEMIISPRPADVPAGGFVTGDWIARFETRSFDDIRALGRNSPGDDRAFAAVARLSEINLALYRTFLQPTVRALATHPMADLARALNPLRFGYRIFADANPWMAGVAGLAAGAAAARRPVAPDNPFLTLQNRMSDQITAALDAYRDMRNRTAEGLFFGIYGSPMVQALLGIGRNTEVRPLAGHTPAEIVARRARTGTYAAELRLGGFDEALVRATLHVLAADRMIDQRSALALNAARRALTERPLAAFKALVRDQFFVLQLEGDRAVAVLGEMVPDAAMRTDLLRQVEAIVSAAGRPDARERDRLDRLASILAVTRVEPADPMAPEGSVASDRGTADHRRKRAPVREPS